MSTGLGTETATVWSGYMEGALQAGERVAAEVLAKRSSSGLGSEYPVSHQNGAPRMAYEMQIRGTQDQVKIRSPWAAALLPIITLGIYHLVWWYRINRELRDYGKAKGYDLGQNPTNSVLALFPGGLIIVPALITYWRGTKRVMGASRLAGKEPLNGWIAIILYLLLAPGLWAYIQVSLNDVWRQEADALPGQELPPAPAGEMPPPLPSEQQRRPSRRHPGSNRPPPSSRRARRAVASGPISASQRRHVPRGSLRSVLWTALS